jgi:predicted  nucleic acid-binding Zn-ribbon protein
MSSDESGVASSSTTATSASANAAMNVFHSFHAIGDEISGLQKERQTIEADMQAKEDEMRRLRDEMAKMELAQRAASKQHAEWTRKLEDLQTEPLNSSSEQPAAPGGLSNMVKRGQLERLIGESRETFLQESVEFRRECARLRTQASSLGLADACTMAYLSAVHGIEIGIGDTTDGSASGMATEQQHVEDTDDLDDDPTQWKHLVLEDAETKDLWNAYVASKERLVGVEQASAATNATLQQWKEKSATRRERVEHLESQLHRVTKENDDLEAKVKELHELAEQPPQQAREVQPNPTEEEARIDGTLDLLFRCTSFNAQSHIFSSSSLTTQGRAIHCHPARRLAPTRRSHCPCRGSRRSFAHRVGQSERSTRTRRSRSLPEPHKPLRWEESVLAIDGATCSRLSWDGRQQHRLERRRPPDSSTSGKEGAATTPGAGTSSSGATWSSRTGRRSTPRGTSTSSRRRLLLLRWVVVAWAVRRSHHMPPRHCLERRREELLSGAPRPRPSRLPR